MQPPLAQIFVPTDGSRLFHHIFPEILLQFAMPLVFHQSGMTLIQLTEECLDVEVFNIDWKAF
jgi:hypothetical protein